MSRMDMFAVRGGNPLRGEVTISGSKNASLPILAATIMTEGRCELSGIPDLADINTMVQLLGTLGMDCRREVDDTWMIQVLDNRPIVAHYNLVRKMRAGVCVLGPLLARRGRACVSLPGGCNIGDRPIDLHLKGLAALGADLRIEKGYVLAEAKRLKGTRLSMMGPSGSTVTGTCNILMAACFAKGTTIIEGAAREPEVVDLGLFLNNLGANISGLGTQELTIEGVEHLEGTKHDVIPDRIEALTYVIAAAITKGDLILHNVCLDHMRQPLEKLEEIGIHFESDPASRPGLLPALRAQGTGELLGTDCLALPYPGIPTDIQAQIMALLTIARGTSVVTDKVFPDRFLHLPELVRLGARIRRDGDSAIINGVRSLEGADVMASDLRASSALVLAALAAKGDSIVRRIYHLDRGYERFEDKIQALGGQIARASDESVESFDSLFSRDRHALKGPTWNRTPAPTREPRK